MRICFTFFLNDVIIKTVRKGHKKAAFANVYQTERKRHTNKNAFGDSVRLYYKQAKRTCQAFYGGKSLFLTKKLKDAPVRTSTTGRADGLAVRKW